MPEVKEVLNKKSEECVIGGTNQQSTPLPEKTLDSEKPKEIRPWFASLSVEEQMAALGFTDHSMLVSLFNLVASTSSSSETNTDILPPGSLDRTTDGSNNFQSMDWETLVSLDDVEQSCGLLTNIATSDTCNYLETHTTLPKEEQVDEQLQQQEQQPNDGVKNECGKGKEKLEFSNLEVSCEEVKVEPDPDLSEEKAQESDDAFRIQPETEQQSEAEQEQQSACDVVKSDDDDAAVVAVGDAAVTAVEIAVDDAAVTAVDLTVDDAAVTAVDMTVDDAEVDAAVESADAVDAAVDPAVDALEAAERVDKEEHAIEESMELAPVSAVDGDKKEAVSKKSFEKVKFVMDKVCAIFPSAVGESLCNESMDCYTPMITLNPVFLATVKGEDLLSAFDNIMMDSPESGEFFSFLCNADKDMSVYSSWFGSLKASITKAASSSSSGTASIPLYMLLLSRFQMSVYEAYIVQTTKEVNCLDIPSSTVFPTTSDANTSSETIPVESDGEKKNEEEIIEVAESGEVDKENDTLANEEQTNVATNTTTKLISEDVTSEEKTAPESAATDTSATPVQKKFPDSVKLLNDVVSLLKGLSEVGEGESIVVKDTFSPCIEMIYSSGYKAKLRLNDLLAVPIDLLCYLYSKRDVKALLKEIDSTAGSAKKHANELLETTEKVEIVSTNAEEPSGEKGSANDPDHSASETPKNGNTTDSKQVETTETDWIDETPTATPTAVNNGPSKKSNKKKKKKKKRKGGGNADASSQVKETSNVRAVPKPEEEEAEEPAAISTPALTTSPTVAPTVAPESVSETAKESSEKESNDTTKTAPSELKVENAEDLNVVSSFDTDKSSVLAGEGDSKLTASETQGPSVGTKGGIHVSRLEGVGTACVVVALPAPVEQKTAANKLKKDTGSHEGGDSAKDENSAWETVELRGRSNRKKSSGRHGTQQSYGSSSSNGQHSSGSKKAKAARTTASRKRTQNRKMVREILSSVLDSVDEEVRRRRIVREGSRLPGNKWAAAVARNNGNSVPGRISRINETQQSKGIRKDATMRDVLVGRQNNSISKHISPLAQPVIPEGPRLRHDGRAGSRQDISGRNDTDQKKVRDKPEKMSPGKVSKIGQTTADQNTAPTVPETLSAVSASSVNTDAFRGSDSRREVPVRDSWSARRDSSSGESAEAAKPQRSLSTSQAGKEGSPPPPLPTLLSPGNANSASSSVASSLDAPHASHRPHHHSSTANENDVGYHLLDVCDRLTRDMSLFMKRRAHALNVRRRERGAVLVALQESLSNIWPGRCSVEMYGSCATQLDLPSSDLDVVVCGLDRPVEVSNHAASTAPEDESAKDTRPTDSTSNTQESHQHTQHQRLSHQHPHQQMQFPMMYGHLSPNSERVIRLAVELERQPWAVHVKPIPTASVPVIKILADPARLPGAAASVGAGDWLMQQHPMSAQAVAVGAEQQGDGAGSHQQSLTHYHPSQTQLPWRGADVVNGLLKVDITFEGPEHGGIGSTEFSARVVQDFCNETGLPPESTPAVQVLMVLKELLAQRRLNEPFSGGLSSYALLLLVISVLRERSVIREELERVERQRRVVAAGGGNSSLHGSGDACSSTTSVSKTNSGPAAGQDQENAQAKQSKVKKQNVPQKTVKSVKQAQTSKPVSTPVGANKKELRKGMEKASQAQAISEKASNASQGDSDNTSSANSKQASASASSSWASIARKNPSTPLARKLSQESLQSSASEKKALPEKKTKPPKVSTFADAVANGTSSVPSPAPVTSPALDRAKIPSKEPESESNVNARSTEKVAKPAKPTSVQEVSLPSVVESKKSENVDPAASTRQQHTFSSTSFESGFGTSPSLFPQGFHDVIEVLCSGDTTAGKLLMHFLLFYGQHFDSQSTAIDYSGKHQRDSKGNKPYSHLSPYMQRRTAGSYDPMTGMLTVDPIVVYDPLEGRESSNVARSCFCWSSIRWVFAQSYMTLSSAVEMSATPTVQTSNGRGRPLANNSLSIKESDGLTGLSETWNGPYSQEDASNMMADPSSPLLELLLSF